MRFRDPAVEALQLSRPEHVCLLICKYLCGEDYHRPDDEIEGHGLSGADKQLLAAFLQKASSERLNYEQFNELLLLLNQDRISRDFFRHFFGHEPLALEELKQPIIDFRGFAMLRFGNFRFAYRELSQSNKRSLHTALWPYSQPPNDLIAQFHTRPPKMLDIQKINRDSTWLIGELTGRIIQKEAEVLRAQLHGEPGRTEEGAEGLRAFGDRLVELSRDLERTQGKALQNTYVYLTWDYVDVYIACSMRDIWEYEETYDFAQAMSSSEELLPLGLRYFDPTQSKCRNPRDKGLIEGLMLKRALCTIYLAQESDTMGKDSELAATLAQSKPVVAYVPRYEPDEYAAKISRYPLEFFRKRVLVLMAEGLFEDPDCMEQMRKVCQDFRGAIDTFLKKMGLHRIDQPFTLWEEGEARFRDENREELDQVCRILAVAECYNFDRRAALLGEKHPLAMQVDLKSGVANGVLVARTYGQCVQLLYGAVTNKLEFAIKHVEGGFTVLEESITESPFRVVTDDVKLTNSFWNLWGSGLA